MTEPLKVEIRCKQCDRLLCRVASAYEMEIKCPRCGHVNKVRHAAPESNLCHGEN